MRRLRQPFGWTMAAVGLLSTTFFTSACDEDLAQTLPQMDVQPRQFDVTVGITQTETFAVEVQNPSNVPLFLDGARLAPNCDVAFSLREETIPEEIDRRGTHNILVQVRPQLESTITCTLIVDAEDDASVADPSDEVANTVDVVFNVTAVNRGLPNISVTPASIEFGRIGQNDVVRETVTITNTGVLDLVFGNGDPAAITTEFLPDTPGDEAIRLTSPVQPGYALAPTQSITLDLVFAPTDLETHSGNLAIRTNDPDTPEILVPVSGVGSQCPVAVATLLEDPDAIEPLDTIRFDGHDSYTDDPNTSVTRWEWTIDFRPPGSTEVLQQISEDRVQLTTDLAGDYQIRLSVYDDTGVRSCTDAVVRVTAQPTDDLHIQLVWDHPTADLDLHLLRDDGVPFTHEGDTYFSNRQPEWFPENPESNPSLDADDNRGYGPENINVETPLPGSRWTVAGHYWNKQTDGDPFTVASLRIYAKGQVVADLQQSLEDDETFWRAVEIVWPQTEAELPTVNIIGITEPFPRPF